ncbi:MAG: hypothetical protein JWM05_2434 [Acidimicrobiales bacterium]|nr:hypothetical protein [Acidimicrobiales bacterium]
MSDADHAPPPAPADPVAAGPTGPELEIDVTAFLPDDAEPAVVAPATSSAAHPADLAELERIEAQLTDVQRALARLDEGTYGRCDRCGDPITDDRLAADPTASLCAAHG